MHIALIFRILGILLMLFSMTMLVPALISLYFDEGFHTPFLQAFAIAFGCGFIICLPVYKRRGDLSTRDGFLITALFWVVLGLFGSLPFITASTPHLSFIDAAFESISGLTTTGATVLTGLDYLPRSILFYRQQLQWLGGIGIIVIALAILPMLGVGGMQLYRAETPGPIKDSKLTPRITGTAKALFLIYLGLTVICAAAYYLAGMSWFDAICHSFTTIAIGGFSTHDASIGYFESPAIMLVCCCFMTIAAVNFALHFFCFNQRSIRHYFKDPEFLFYISMLTAAIIVICSALIFTGTYTLNDGLLHGVFQVISITTTSGFATADFAHWPLFLPILLLFFSLVGGCAGSTAGGIKVIRVLLICKQGLRELGQLVHPNAVIPLKVGSRSVPDRVISAVWSFFAVYVFTFAAILMLLMASGIDFITAYSAVAASLNNLGPGLGEVAAHYGNINDFAKLTLCFSMLLGRLEIFTLLVLFTPTFWRS
jgi:trk system potassium uptake protein TrkH